MIRTFDSTPAVIFKGASAFGGDGVDIECVASIAVITPDAAASRRLYMDVLGLPLNQLDGDYFASEEIGGCKHFGVWPLSQAAEACFGVSSWPAQVTVPQMSLEFELADPRAVADGAEELRSGGYQLLHDAKEEPWGQTVARLLSPEGVVVGLSYAPSLHP
jgi:catechol 2,3-dioxygenase-like lactoylglutathione lyase family enzyme